MKKMHGDSSRSPLDYSDAHDLIEFANEWAALGDSIQTQVEYICNVRLEDQADDEVNPNAIKHAKRTGVYGANDDIDQAIDEYLAEHAQREAIEDAIDDDPGEQDEDSDPRGPAADAEWASQKKVPITYVSSEEMATLKMKLDRQDAIEPAEPETEECAPTPEAVRLIQGGDPWVQPCCYCGREFDSVDAVRTHESTCRDTPTTRTEPVSDEHQRELDEHDREYEEQIGEPLTNHTTKKKKMVTLDLQLGDEEYIIAYYIDGTYDEGKTYYTDSHGDAIATRCELKKWAEEHGFDVTIENSLKSHEGEN